MLRDVIDDVVEELGHGIWREKEAVVLSAVLNATKFFFKRSLKRIVTVAKSVFVSFFQFVDVKDAIGLLLC